MSVLLMFPLIVRSSPDRIVKLPLIVDSPKVKSLTSLKLTFTPVTLTVPVKLLLAFVAVISPLLAERSMVDDELTAPVYV